MTALLRPFFSYFGSKWRIAPRYPAPAHASIVEPFAGSAGYALRYPDLQVLLVDLDHVVCGVWSYLIGASRSDLLSLPLIEPGQSTDDLQVCEEARWLIGFWCARSAARPLTKLVPWGRDPSLADRFWSPVVRARIASQVDAIKHWRVRMASYDTIANDRATYFVDPPYTRLHTRADGHVEMVGAKYRHQAKRIDFAALGTWCRTRRGQVIACEQLGATWLPFRRFATSRTAKVGTDSEEAIWTNDREQLRLFSEAS